MTLQINLDQELQARLEATAQRQGLSVEEFAKRCVAERLLAEPPGSAQLAWKIGQELFGSFDSGRSDVSENVEQIVGQEIDTHADRSRAD